MTTVYKSSFSRLKELGPFFTINMMQNKMGISNDMARVYISRWKNQNLVKLSGPKTGVYYNLLKINNHNQDFVTGQVIKHVYGDAVIMGNSVLHNAHWTTQIPNALNIAVKENASNKILDGVQIFRRPQEWFDYIAHENHRDISHSSYNLISLLPEMALADGIHHNSLSALHPDDYEIPEENAESFIDACEMIGVPDDIYNTWLLASDITIGDLPKL